MKDLTLAHLGYVVKDMEKSLKRFQHEGARLLIPPVKDPVQRVEVCLVELAGGVPVELVAPLSGAECPVTARLARGGGLDHICYAVDHLAQALAEEEANGAIMLAPPRLALAFNREVAFVYRKSGLVVEYMCAQERNENRHG
jgi:methylmalonyl-CoA/ethylmalonyl-CoA epimerase